MTKLQNLIRLIDQFEKDLGIWADILGGVALFAIFFAILMMVPA